MDCSPPGYSVHGISQARVLEQVSISFFRGSYRTRDWTCVSCVASGFFTTELPGKPDEGSVQFNSSVVSNSLWPHDSQHARPPCPLPTPGVYSYSCRWCHPAISSSVIPFSSCPQPLPASGSFPMSQLFAWGGQSTEVSASASTFPMNTQDLIVLIYNQITSWHPVKKKTS